MLLLTFDVFFTFSRTLEFIPMKLGPVSLVVTLRILVLLFGVFSGGVFVLLDSKIAKALLFFTIWMMLGIPFSSWKGGSVDSIMRSWLPALFGFLGGGALIYSVSAARRLVITLAFCPLAILVLCRVFGGVQESSSRFQVGGGTLSNANDLATMLLLGLPCMVFYIQDNKGRRWFGRFLMLAAIPFLLKVVAQTASRTALVTVGVYGAMLFLSTSGIKRIAIAGFVLVGGILFLMTAPSATLARYRTILPFLPQTDMATQISAEESSYARRELLQQGIELTIRHPIFGVGVGTFQSASAQFSKSKNERESWHETHNTYMQVASECGIPGLIAYVAAIWFSFRGLWWIRQQSRFNPELLYLNRLANYLFAMLICYSISAFFASMAYLPMFPMMAAIIAGFERHAKHHILSRVPAPVSTYPMMGMQTPVLAR